MEHEMMVAQAVTISKLYDILGLVIPIGVLFTCGLMFIIITIPNIQQLDNYRKMRHVMAFAYFLFVPCHAVEYLFWDMSGRDVGIQQVIYLTLASSQAVLFTLTFLTLLDVKLLKWQRIYRMAFPALLLVVAVVATYLFCSKAFFAKAFYLFFGAYAIQLAYYIKLFVAIYKRFRFRMDNYFSDHETEQMRWIVDSFFTALLVGTAALVTTLIMHPLVLLIFSIGFVAFYLYFAFRFVNYAYRFNIIKHAMEGYCLTMECSLSKKKKCFSAEPSTTNHETICDSANFSLLEKRIEQWVQEKHFVEQGITMDMLAQKVYTNRSYLSNYINTCKRKTFREWINTHQNQEPTC